MFVCQTHDEEIVRGTRKSRIFDRGFRLLKVCAIPPRQSSQTYAAHPAMRNTFQRRVMMQAWADYLCRRMESETPWAICRSIASERHPSSLSNVQAVARNPCGVTSLLSKPNDRKAPLRAVPCRGRGGSRSAGKDILAVCGNRLQLQKRL